MALWGNKSLGVLFGGVTDEDTNEETLESVFHNDLYVLAIIALNNQAQFFQDSDIRFLAMDVGFLCFSADQKSKVERRINR